MDSASQTNVCDVSQQSSAVGAKNGFTATFNPAEAFAFGTRESSVRHRDADHPLATGDGPRS